MPPCRCKTKRDWSDLVTGYVLWSGDQLELWNMSDTSPWKGFISGGAGGVCLVLTGHPLDTMKVCRALGPEPVTAIDAYVNFAG